MSTETITNAHNQTEQPLRHMGVQKRTNHGADDLSGEVLQGRALFISKRIHTHTLTLINVRLFITFIHLADTFVQSDTQEGQTIHKPVI